MNLGSFHMNKYGGTSEYDGLNFSPRPGPGPAPFGRNLTTTFSGGSLGGGLMSGRGTALMGKSTN